MFVLYEAEGQGHNTSMSISQHQFIDGDIDRGVIDVNIDKHLHG